MRLTLCAAICAGTFLATAAALPSPSSLFHHNQRRGIPGAVYVCTGENFTGTCGWTAPSDTCHIAGTGADAPQSIGPDPNGYCNLYSDQACAGKQISLLWFPGQASDLPTFGSFKCFPLGGQSNTLQSVSNNLAGGVGSRTRQEMKGVIQKMEKDGFSEGLIGLKKKEYV